MRKIPSYELYGEASTARPPWHDAFNFEWIPERSRPNDWNIPAHRHDALLQFLYIRSGQGHVIIESEKTPFNPPCLVILPAQVVHGFAFSPEIDGLVVTAAQRALESIAKSVSSTLVAVLQRPAVIPVSGPSASDETLMPLFHMLENEFRRGAAGYTAAGMSLLMALFVQAARLIDHANVPVAALAARRSLQIRRFRELIAQHFREHRPVEFYADALDVTPPQLGRICREELGSSPTALINDHLIREAQRDLVYSGMTVKQIAHSLGFEDSAYFSRYFRKQTGATPREFQSSAHRDLALGTP
ncbi:helix-turn-helix domain-containing protein [Paraburkholderia unamae]|uniref:AraC family transcriptional activator of pobA n=1 Tax=Paraburkholderia unamae TaxID=219649 RepID=A0ABX5KI54_9BURK|nr:helix-turn-helix domain-containing protein [Paraburkholderia unamae]PVX75776.1 AraC family transcriptional activator of pobA [Paraburkholderia unamae]RAR57990.1 AraC family transcriptional activator of pobA [Paraburkholderia unamae]CAG9259982.1 Transcriptional regulator [Paraburkholderia unamae]